MSILRHLLVIRVSDRRVRHQGNKSPQSLACQVLLFNICPFEASAPLWGTFYGVCFRPFCCTWPGIHCFSAWHMSVARMLVECWFENTPYELFLYICEDLWNTYDEILWNPYVFSVLSFLVYFLMVNRSILIIKKDVKSIKFIEL